MYSKNGTAKNVHGTEGKVLATVLKSMADFDIFILLNWCHSYRTNYAPFPVPVKQGPLHGTHDRVMGGDRKSLEDWTPLYHPSENTFDACKSFYSWDVCLWFDQSNSNPVSPDQRVNTEVPLWLAGRHSSASSTLLWAA